MILGALSAKTRQGQPSPNLAKPIRSAPFLEARQFDTPEPCGPSLRKPVERRPVTAVLTRTRPTTASLRHLSLDSGELNAETCLVYALGRPLSATGAKWSVQKYVGPIPAAISSLHADADGSFRAIGIRQDLDNADLLYSRTGKTVSQRMGFLNPDVRRNRLTAQDSASRDET